MKKSQPRSRDKIWWIASVVLDIFLDIVVTRARICQTYIKRFTVTSGLLLNSVTVKWYRYHHE